VPGIAEFRSTVSRDGALRALSIDIEIEPSAANAPTIAARAAAGLRQALGLTVPVRVVDAGTLPRFEMKARRFVVAE
jgi:phenylacetate-CoA ligase